MFKRMNESTPALESRLTLVPYPSGAVYLKPRKYLCNAGSCVFAATYLPSTFHLTRMGGRQVLGPHHRLGHLCEEVALLSLFA